MVMNFSGKESGSALVMVLVATAVLLLLGSALVTYAVNEKFIANHEEDNTSLYYITESGIEAGFAVIRRFFNHPTSFSGTVGGGSYDVEFIFPPATGQIPGHPERSITAMQRVIKAVGHLDGKTRTLAVIVGLCQLYDRALLVSENLQITDSNIYGNLHVNKSMIIKGYNSVNPSEAQAGDFTFVDRTKVTYNIQQTSYIDIKGTRYSNNLAFPNEWQVPEIIMPVIDYDGYAREADCIITLTNTTTWTQPPACYYAGKKVFLVEGYSLTIKPGPGDTFDFNGVLIVKDGDLTLDGSAKNATLNLNGFIVCNGLVRVRGIVNYGLTDKMLLIVAQKNIEVKDIDSEQDLFFGGYLLLFSLAEVQITAKNYFDMYGTIVADKVQLEKCNLHYVPDIFWENPDMIPGFGVIIQEWLKH